MVKLLNPLMMLVFKINCFPGQIGFKFTVTETHSPTQSALMLMKGITNLLHNNLCVCVRARTHAHTHTHTHTISYKISHFIPSHYNQYTSPHLLTQIQKQSTIKIYKICPSCQEHFHPKTLLMCK